MSLAIVFRRTPRNHNSFGSIVGALERLGLPDGLRVVLVDQAAPLPKDTWILAYSFSTPELAQVQDEVVGLRASGAKALLIAGGPHPTADPEGTRKAGFDVVFVGEGEQTFPQFIQQAESGRVPDPSVRRAEPAGIDLDATLHVAGEHGLFPFAEISRGCPHRCAFCQVPLLFGSRMRHRSPEVVAEGVAFAVRAGYRRVRYLTPDAFAYAGGRLRPGSRAISALLAACRQSGASQQMLGSFPSEVRPDHVDTKLLELVKTHCFNRTLVLGAQSGSNRVLGLMHRGHTVDQARKAILETAEAGLTPHVDVLFCFPGEQPEERLATLELARWCIERAGARIHAHVYLPLPGTSAWPKRPEPLEQRIVSALKRMKATGRLDGDWEHQAVLGLEILRWREQGKILV